MAWAIFAVVTSVLVVLGALVSLLIEDWSRDLKQHSAATGSVAGGALADIHSDLPPAEVANLTMAALSKLSGWRLDRVSEAKDRVTLALVRATWIPGWSSDVVVVIEGVEGGGARLSATSTSRWKVGDFGQNPRNLRELLTAVRAKLSPSAGSK